MKLGSIVILLLLLTTLIGCGDKQETANNDEPVQVDFDLGGQAVTLAGITFTPPTQWLDLGPGMMKKAAYAYGPVGDDVDSATVGVFYFGPTDGGDVESNLTRWINQIGLPEGAKPEEAVTRTDFEVDGLKIHQVALSGSFVAGAMMGGGKLKEGYRLIGFVVEGPEGNLFFKLTGPEGTAREMGAMMDGMVKAIKKAA